MVKRYATDICNTVAYEESILAQVLCHTLAELRAPGLFDTDCLVSPRPASPKMLAFLSESMEIHFTGPAFCSHQA